MTQRVFKRGKTERRQGLQLALLTEIIERRSPTRSGLVEMVPTGVSEGVRTELIDIVGAELFDRGIDEENNVTAYGRQLEHLIDALHGLPDSSRPAP